MAVCLETYDGPLVLASCLPRTWIRDQNLCSDACARAIYHLQHSSLVPASCRLHVKRYLPFPPAPLHSLSHPFDAHSSFLKSNTRVSAVFLPPFPNPYLCIEPPSFHSFCASDLCPLVLSGLWEMMFAHKAVVRLFRCPQWHL